FGLRSSISNHDLGTFPTRRSSDLVWSRDQVATLIVLPPDGSVEGLGEQLDRVYELLDEQFRQGARQRMYLSGVNTALADTLAARSEEHTSELQSRENLVCRRLLEK